VVEEPGRVGTTRVDAVTGGRGGERVRCPGDGQGRVVTTPRFRGPQRALRLVVSRGVVRAVAAQWVLNQVPWPEFASDIFPPYPLGREFFW